IVSAASERRDRSSRPKAAAKVTTARGVVSPSQFSKSKNLPINDGSTCTSLAIETSIANTEAVDARIPRATKAISKSSQTNDSQPFGRRGCLVNAEGGASEDVGLSPICP